MLLCFFAPLAGKVPADGSNEVSNAWANLVQQQQQALGGAMTMGGAGGVGPLTMPTLASGELVDWSSVASLMSNGEGSTGASGAMAIGPLHAQLLAQIGTLDLRVRQLVAQLVDELQPGIVLKQSGEWSFSINQLTESTILQIYAMLATEKAGPEAAQVNSMTGAGLSSQLLASSQGLNASGSLVSTPSTPFSPSTTSATAQGATTPFPGSPNGAAMLAAGASALELNPWLLAGSGASLTGSHGFPLASSFAQSGNVLGSSATALEKLNVALNSSLGVSQHGGLMGSSSPYSPSALPASSPFNPAFLSQLNAFNMVNTGSNSLGLSSETAALSMVSGESSSAAASSTGGGHKRGPIFSSSSPSSSAFASAAEFDAFSPSAKRAKHFEPRDSGRLHSLKLAGRLANCDEHSDDGADEHSTSSEYSALSHSDSPSSPATSSSHMMGVIPTGVNGFGASRNAYNFGQKLAGAPVSPAASHHHNNNNNNNGNCSPSNASGSSISSTSTTINADEGIYSCNHCKRCYPGLAALNKHMRVHHDERHFSCSHPGCNKRFSHSSTLKDHMNIHFQRKPYICKECGKGFPNGSNLNRHARIHTKSKPYVCPVCNKAFSQSSNLRVHQKIHDRPPRFASE